MGQPRLNLKNVTTLLVDSDQFTRGLVAQMLRGFGMDFPTVCETGAQAKHHLMHHYADLCIFEGAHPDMPSADLIRWIRRQEKSPFRFVPIIVMSGYTQLRHIADARDAGANIVIKKPVSPQSLFDRITWVARVTRPFIEAGDYMGPDRRFREITPPEGEYRRETDDQVTDGDKVIDMQKSTAA
ncbi:MAG TPA: response regulator [Rhizomicrobium sp.]